MVMPNEAYAAIANGANPFQILSLYQLVVLYPHWFTSQTSAASIYVLE